MSDEYRPEVKIEGPLPEVLYPSAFLLKILSRLLPYHTLHYAKA